MESGFKSSKAFWQSTLDWPKLCRKCSSPDKNTLSPSVLENFLQFPTSLDVPFANFIRPSRGLNLLQVQRRAMPDQASRRCRETKSKSLKTACSSGVRTGWSSGGVRTAFWEVNSWSKLLMSVAPLSVGTNGGFTVLANRASQSISWKTENSVNPE